MSQVKQKRIVKINENDLVDLIDNIVNEAVAAKKQEWLIEHTKKEATKTSVLESKIAKLEEQFKAITKNKK